MDDVLHVLLDLGFMTAFDAHIGKAYDSQKKRIPKGRDFTSSHGTYGQIFCSNEDDVTIAI